MTKYFAFFCIFFSAIAARSAQHRLAEAYHSVVPTFDFVIDIDGTLTDSEVGETSREEDVELLKKEHMYFGTSAHQLFGEEKVELKFYNPSKNWIETDSYYLRDGAKEFVASLISLPNARVSFMSGGAELRNRELLKKLTFSKPIRENLQLSRAEEVTFASHAYKILSLHHLKTPIQKLAEEYRIEYAPHLRSNFFDSFIVKDLTSITPAIENVLLVDNRSDMVAGGQEKNFVPVESVSTEDLINLPRDLMSTFKYWKEESDPLLRARAKKSIETYFVKRNELARIRGMIEVAMKLALEQKISLRHANQEVQAQAENHARNMEFYKIGERVFRKVNPKFNLSHLPQIAQSHQEICEATLLKNRKP